MTGIVTIGNTLTGALQGRVSLTGALYAVPTLSGQISHAITVGGAVSGEPDLSGDLSVSVYSPDLYTGSYDITPCETAQVIEIKDRFANANITVEPIPSNYGKITYNGSTITVS